MRQKLIKAALIGVLIGTVTTFLSLPIWPYFAAISPTFEWLARLAGQGAGLLTTGLIRLFCGPSPNIGCSSGLGLLLFLALWPMCFGTMLMLLGAAIGMLFVVLRETISHWQHG